MESLQSYHTLHIKEIFFYFSAYQKFDSPQNNNLIKILFRFLISGKMNT